MGSWVHRMEGAATRIWSLPPVFRALLLMLASTLIVVPLCEALEIAGLFLPTWMMACMNGLLSMAAVKWMRLDWWWRVICLIFPVALNIGTSSAVPPAAFLLCFLLFAGLFWSVYSTRVPYYPSSVGARAWVLNFVAGRTAVRFIDIGSGLGGLVLRAVDMPQVSVAHGVELAPLPWLLSCCAAKLRRSHARFFRCDYRNVDLSRYDVVFAYLSPAAMPDLWQQARSQMRPGSVLLSFEFVVPNTTPDIQIVPDSDGETLYGWNM